MATSRLIPAATAFSVAIALVVITALRSTDPQPSLDALALPDKSDRGEHSPANRPPMASAPAASDPLSAQDPAWGGIGSESAKSKENLLDLQRRFRSEKLDPNWAAVQERAIANAVVGSKHDGFDTPLPGAIDAQCRSTLCSIRMTYLDENDAANMQVKIMLGLPKSISMARTFYLPNSNGGVDVQIFAGNSSSVL